jgi:very-short-patch-repair endonuclease
MIGNTYGNVNLGQKRTLDQCENIAKGAKLAWTDPKVCEAHREVMLGNTNALGNKLSEDTKKQMSKNNAMKRPEVARKHALANNHNPSFAEAQVASVLHRKKLNRFEYNGQVDAGVSVDGKVPDFVDKKRKLIIEVRGGYYRRGFNEFTENRANKLSTYYANGYRVLELWDYELYLEFDYDNLADKITMFLTHSTHIAC